MLIIYIIKYYYVVWINNNFKKYIKKKENRNWDDGGKVENEKYGNMGISHFPTHESLVWTKIKSNLVTVLQRPFQKRFQIDHFLMNLSPFKIGTSQKVRGVE